MYYEGLSHTEISLVLGDILEKYTTTIHRLQNPREGTVVPSAWNISGVVDTPVLEKERTIIAHAVERYRDDYTYLELPTQLMYALKRYTHYLTVMKPLHIQSVGHSYSCLSQTEKQQLVCHYLLGEPEPIFTTQKTYS